MAGLSVGAFAAAVAAGALAFRDGLRLVKLRGELMEKAYPKGYGLSVVIGLNEQQLSAIVPEMNKPESPVFLANLNAPTQDARPSYFIELTVTADRVTAIRDFRYVPYIIRDAMIELVPHRG